MSEIERYDVLVVGSGESGKYMAWTMAKAGHRTAVIERKLIGGSCPNVACLPSKNVIRSASVASLAKRGGGIWAGTRISADEHARSAATQAQDG
jgi:pyruvate/2-oxoglutarate dehydrogenase complex dihydrolipoamide dehydrogenase (E3) component